MKKCKNFGIGIISLFLITTVQAAFWDDWVSSHKLHDNYQNADEILIKEQEATREALEAKKRAVQAYNESQARLNMAVNLKFNAHCLLYSFKKQQGEEPKDARVEPACNGGGVELYKSIMHKGLNTVSQ